MKALIINGTMRRGSTYHLTHMVLDKLDPKINLETKEFFLPKELPNFCVGCYNCILKGHEKCPHATSVEPIHQAMMEADLIILTSPVYVFDVSGQMKSFLDHFGFQWLSHRPDASMFNKIGLSVVTAAGAGLNATTKTLQTNLTWWGMKRTYSLSHAVMAASFQETTDKTKAKLDKKASKLAKTLSKTLLKKDQMNASIKTRLLFNLMKLGKKGHPEWNQLDYDFWKQSGYFDDVKPWIIKAQ